MSTPLTPPPLPVEPPPLPLCGGTVRPPFTPPFEGAESAWEIVHHKATPRETEEDRDEAIMRYWMLQEEEAKRAQEEEEQKACYQKKKEAIAQQQQQNNHLLMFAIRFVCLGIGILLMVATLFGPGLVVLFIWWILHVMAKGRREIEGGRGGAGGRDVSLSGGDWGRLGTLSGMNMYKQDQQIAQMKAINDGLEKNNQMLNRLTKK